MSSVYFYTNEKMFQLDLKSDLKIRTWLEEQVLLYIILNR